jgi:polysaccharide biosynthesis protein PslG
MIRIPRLALLATLAALAVAMTAAPADAAKRRVPFGFFGTVLPPQMSNASVVPDLALDQQMALMASSGVESVRVTPIWQELEPARGTYSFARLDRVVAAAARHGLLVNVTVTATPQWNSVRPNDPDGFRWPPRDPAPFGELMRQLVLRYGPSGSLWAQDPSLPRVPIRQWQIWNEQTAIWFWHRRPWAPSYKRLLRTAYRAIHRADRGAKVVAGSIVNYGRFAHWDMVRQLYQTGAKRFFDVIALHPFTNSPSVRRTVWQTLEIVRRVRAEMRRRGDGRKPIILTELTWPASVGRVPKAGLVSFATTRRGQVSRLKATYRRFARVRRRIRVTQAYWYAWATPYDAEGSLSTVSFRFSGLTRVRGSVFSPLPILRSYANVAAKYEGCRKSADARRCR